MSHALLPTPPVFDQLGLPVEISQIETQLQQFFMDDDEAGGGIARASLINLALFSEDASSLEEDAETLAELTREAACRSLFIFLDRDQEESMARAWVQAHCQMDRNGAKTVCSEQISFYLAGKVPGMLQNIVFAHLDSDLPLAFWWRGAFTDAFVTGLHSRIDRLLFDSEWWDEPEDQFRMLLAAHQEQAAPFVMHDLAFSRLNAIRQAVANAFDRSDVVSQLSTLSEVRVRFAGGYGMSARYLAAWIATRLGMELDQKQAGGSKWTFSGKAKGAPSQLVIDVSKLDAEREGMIEVDFDLDGARVEISRCQTRQFIRTLTHRDGCQVEEDWLPAKTQSDVDLVGDLLNKAGRNRAFLETVPMVQDFLAFRSQNR